MNALEVRQRANGCNQDNEAQDWGVPCVSGGCICEREARSGLIMCTDCGELPADGPGKQCPRCFAYSEHTGAA